jgi:hypothetical protein
MEQERPIVFICHSLGGIVAKKACLPLILLHSSHESPNSVSQALVLAHQYHNHYGNILSSCKAIVFMGTPHRGSDIALWAAMISEIVNATSVSSTLRTELLRDLGLKSMVLRDISRQFVPRASMLAIVSFVEKEFTPGLRRLVNHTLRPSALP